MAGPVVERQFLVDGIRVFARVTGGEGTPTVFVHGNPTHSDDWLPFVERLAGPAVALDLPGWGRSERPDPECFDCSMLGLGRFLARLLDEAGIGAYQLACHDWGAVGLIAAQAEPGRVRRLLMINAVPLLPGYRWHWIARYFWRVRGAGELFNLAATKQALRLLSRPATANPGPLAEERIEAICRRWPRGTWPQMLRLYRSAHPAELAAAGSCLAALRCPALVVWGASDPFIPVRFAREYARRLPNAEVVEVEGAGHWPWIERPELIERAVAFLDA